MSIDHNRIKVADLEKNQPNKTLITNENGELEFSDITGGSPNLQSVLDEGNEVQFESSYLNFLSGDVNERTFEVGINNGSPVGSGSEGSFLLLENDMLELQTDNDQKRGTIGVYFGDIELSQFNKTNNKKTSIQFNNPTATTSLRFPAKSEGTYTLATTDDLTSNSENFVHKTGEVSEIIDGQKRFTDTVIFRGQDTENWIEIDGKITFNETGGNAIHIKPVSGLEGEFFHTLPAKSGTYAMLDDLSTPVSATTMVKGVVKLAGDLGGTADLPTVPGLSGKENTITATTSADYFRGDKTFQPLNKAAVGLSNVDNTTDLAKPVSTSAQTALNLKANINSPTFTGTVGGITKSMVGLSNVDNTSDANKPVSTASQTALNLKANLAGTQTFTGVHNFPTAGPGTSNNQAANTEFVRNEITAIPIPTLDDVLSSGENAYDRFLRMNDTGDGEYNELTYRTIEMRASTYPLGYAPSSFTIQRTVDNDYTITGYNIVHGSKTVLHMADREMGGDADFHFNPDKPGGSGYIIATIDDYNRESLVSNLSPPTGFQSKFVIVTDALAPSYLSPVVGGGTVKVPAFWNGTAWVCH